jgi:hypothetical protein
MEFFPNKNLEIRYENYSGQQGKSHVDCSNTIYVSIVTVCVRDTTRYGDKICRL